jgi:hypothetical protein
MSHVPSVDFDPFIVDANSIFQNLVVSSSVILGSSFVWVQFGLFRNLQTNIQAQWCRCSYLCDNFSASTQLAPTK